MNANISSSERLSLISFYDFELDDGSVVRLTSSFWGQKKLREINPDAAKRMNAILQNEKAPAMDEIIELLYICYLSACNLTGETPIDEELFYIECGNDIGGCMEAFKELFTPKKK